MIKVIKRQKNKLALVVSALLLAGSLSGCGQKEAPAELHGSAIGDGFGDTGSEVQKGAYLEKEQPLEGIPDDVTVKQLYAVDDKIHLVTAREEGEGFKLQEWELQEDSFAEVTKPWLTDLTVAGETWVDIKLMQDGNGIQYLFCNLLDDELDAYVGHLWRSDGDEAKDITPEKWSMINEQWGIYENIKDITALDNGTLVAISVLSVDRVKGEDGSIIESEQLMVNYEEGMITDGENAYLIAYNSSGSIKGVEKWIGGSHSNVTELPFGQSASYGVLLCVMPDGTLLSADGGGIFRCDAGAEDWVKLISGMETSFSLPGCWCTDLAALQDGRIYALFHEEGNVTKLLTYEYDPEAMPVVRTVLKMYAVEENTLLQNAAGLYHKEHPEVLIDLQFSYTQEDKYSGEQLDYNAVFQQVNTMLMGSDAPDILVLDHLNKDSFMEKGLLADIQDIVVPMEESGELLSNIVGAYRQEDGKQYIVPLQFGFPFATGRDISKQDMASIQSLGSFLSKQQESYMGPRTVSEVVDLFYPYFCGPIVENKELNREELAEYLKALKQIADNCGIIEKRRSNERGYGMWDLAYRAKFAIRDSEGFRGSMFIVAIAEYIKGDFAAFENTFIPYAEVGISAKSEYQDVAKDFLAFCLSEKVQGRDYYTGYPVNAKSMEILGAADNSDLAAATSIEIADGVEEMFVIDPVSPEMAQKLIAVCKGLDRPYKEDSKIREVLIETLPPYFQGTQSLEETLDKIEGGLKMYLAE